MKGTWRMKPFRLDGQVAVITGGGSGLGLAIARCLAAAGARPILLGRREDALRRAAHEIGNAGYLVHDVTNTEQSAAVVERITSQQGPISILVNNAGNHLKRPALETTDEEFASLVQTHLCGAFALTRACAAGMVDRHSGSILFTASMAALFGVPLVAAYSAAKAAYLGLVRALATELSPHGVRVNAIAPGWIDSPMMRKALNGDPARSERILARTPMRRFGEPDDIGWAAVYLCSEAARFVTGAVLPVDGGMSIGF